MNRRKPRMQTSVVSRYPTPAPVHDFVLLFLPPCGPHLTPLATPGPSSQAYLSLHRPFAPTLQLHQRKSSRNLHLQYSTKSQSTPRCQSLITARSDHPPVLGRSGTHIVEVVDDERRDEPHDVPRHPDTQRSRRRAVRRAARRAEAPRRAV
jgi:hypothetical protein